MGGPLSHQSQTPALPSKDQVRGLLRKPPASCADAAFRAPEEELRYSPLRFALACVRRAAAAMLPHPRAGGAAGAGGAGGAGAVGAPPGAACSSDATPAPAAATSLSPKELADYSYFCHLNAALCQAGVHAAAAAAAASRSRGLYAPAPLPPLFYAAPPAGAFRQALLLHPSASVGSFNSLGSYMALDAVAAAAKAAAAASSGHAGGCGVIRPLAVPLCASAASGGSSERSGGSSLPAARRPYKRRADKASEQQHDAAHTGTGSASVGASEGSGTGSSAAPAAKARRREGDTRACSNCGTSDTPFWRKAADGSGSLCNACAWPRMHGCGDLARACCAALRCIPAACCHLAMLFRPMVRADAPVLSLHTRRRLVLGQEAWPAPGAAVAARQGARCRRCCRDCCCCASCCCYCFRGDAGCCCRRGRCERGRDARLAA
jgi:hypothetical protein